VPAPVANRLSQHEASHETSYLYVVESELPITQKITFIESGRKNALAQTGLCLPFPLVSEKERYLITDIERTRR